MLLALPHWRPRPQHLVSEHPRLFNPYHVTPHRSQFRQYLDRHYDSVWVGNSHHCAIIGIGTIELNLSGGSTLVLHNVRYVPWAFKTFDLSWTTWRSRHPCRILIRRVDTPQREPPACSRTEGTFLVPIICHTQRGWLVSSWYPCVIALARTTQTSQQGRHHAPIKSRLHPQTLLLGPPVFWAFGKQVAASRLTSAPRESSPLDLVLLDVWGPMPHQSLGGASYFVSFIDNSTRKVWDYRIQTKDRVFSIFYDWLAMVENKTSRKLKCLRTDNGGEFSEPTIWESSSLKNSSNFAENAEFQVNTRHPIVRSRTILLNAWIRRFRNASYPCSNTPDYQMTSRRRLYSR